MKTFAQFRENFADGRNPQDKGDSARHGIPKKASIAQLEKIRSSDSSSPRKKQLAHWQINMRRGKAKANEDYENPYRFDWGTPEGTAYMKKKTPKMKFEPMFKNTKVSLPATKKIISSSQ